MANWFTRACTKPSSFLGFHKAYNFPLWVIFGGALLGFSIARLSYLAYDTNFKEQAAPGEWFWFREGIHKYAMIIHLATILPAAILAVFQFVPQIRYKLLLLHRIDGYIIIICVITTVASAIIMSRRAFGGTIETQAGVYFLGFIVLVSVFMAYYNIKKLQIDQHRNWMLRAWVYMGSIISMRIIMIISSLIIGKIRSYHGLFRCDELQFTDEKTYNANFTTLCKTFGPHGVVPVPALFGSDDATKATVGATFRATFGMSLWFALAIHIIGVEIYFHLTPAETARLRQASYERQLKAGMINPGSAGLTSDRLGDAEWKPKVAEDDSAKSNQNDVYLVRGKSQNTEAEDIGVTESGRRTPVRQMI